MSSTLAVQPRNKPSSKRQVATLPLVTPSVVVLLIWMIVPLLTLDNWSKKQEMW
jgi:sorbitol/mannitol transport system permease protein